MNDIICAQSCGSLIRRLDSLARRPSDIAVAILLSEVWIELMSALDALDSFAACDVGALISGADTLHGNELYPKYEPYP